MFLKSGINLALFLIMKEMKNILIVDDERNFVRSLSEGLTMLEKDFSVMTANDVNTAINELDSKRIDILITDLNMPETDGFDLLLHVLRHYPDLPVIVITAYYNDDVIRRLHSLGFYYHMEKPLDFNCLLGMTVYLLENRQDRNKMSGNIGKDHPDTAVI